MLDRRAITAVTLTRTASVIIASISSRPRRDIREPTRPAQIAPSRNAPSEVRLAGAEKPGAPAAAKPSTTTLPVMFAVNTRPSPR